jgi:hypothetical protein
MSTSLLRPPNYSRDFLLYLVIEEMTIGMVLVQEDDMLEEHVKYYLRQGLVGLELNYSHVDKISLEAMHVVQWFYQYIFLRNTIVIVVVNPFQYVLTSQVIGGNISIWIIILQQFEFDFVSKSKKLLVFAELISELLVESSDMMTEESPIKGDIFLIAYSDPW